MFVGGRGEAWFFTPKLGRNNRIGPAKTVAVAVVVVVVAAAAAVVVAVVVVVVVVVFKPFQTDTFPQRNINNNSAGKFDESSSLWHENV